MSSCLSIEDAVAQHDGYCPTFSYDKTYSLCCSDLSCPADRKCCSMEYMSYCVEPLPGELSATEFVDKDCHGNRQNMALIMGTSQIEKKVCLG